MGSPVDDFLAQKPTYLSGLDRSIQAGKQSRRAAQQVARGQQTAQRGLGKLQGLGGGMDPKSFLNPTPVGATVPGVPQPGAQALGPGGGGQSPARVMAGGQRPGMGGPAQVGAGAQPQNLGNIGHQPVRPSAIGKVAGGTADDIAGQGLGSKTRFTPSGTTGPSVKALGAGPPKTAVFGPGGTSTAATQTAAKGLLQGKGLTGVFSKVTKQGLMKGAGVAGTGYMLSGIIDGLDIGGENTVLDRGASAGILGASIAGGGAIAMGAVAGGPVTLAAAAAGAIMFGGYKALWGEDRDTPTQMSDSIQDTKETIQSLTSMYGLDQSAANDIMMQFDASTSLMLDQEDKAGLKNYLVGLTSQLPTLLQGAKDEQAEGEKEQERYDRTLAMQAQFAPMFEKTMDTATAASKNAYDQQMSVSDVLVDRQPQLAALVKSSAADDQAAQARLMAAYGAQVTMGPATASDTQELQRRLEQEQILQQSMQQ